MGSLGANILGKELEIGSNSVSFRSLPKNSLSFPLFGSSAIKIFVSVSLEDFLLSVSVSVLSVSVIVSSCVGTKISASALRWEQSIPGGNLRSVCSPVGGPTFEDATSGRLGLTLSGSLSNSTGGGRHQSCLSIFVSSEDASLRLAFSSLTALTSTCACGHSSPRGQFATACA